MGGVQEMRISEVLVRKPEERPLLIEEGVRVANHEVTLTPRRGRSRSFWM
jgi:hypothetical protein